MIQSLQNMVSHTTRRPKPHYIPLRRSASQKGLEGLTVAKYNFVNRETVEAKEGGNEGFLKLKIVFLQTAILYSVILFSRFILWFT